MGRLGLVVMLVAGMASTASADGPTPDTGTGTAVVPAVPTFELLVPSANAMGVQQLRALGRRSYAGKPVTVRGYVTFVYDCVEANLEPYTTRAQIATAVTADPTKCESAKLFLGDAKTTPAARSLRVADLPAGTWKVGDYLEVAGTFAYASPGGDTDRNGLVVYASASKVKPETPTTVQLPAPHTVAAFGVPKPTRRSPPPAEKMRAIAAVMQNGLKHAEWRQWKEAQTEYERVVATWDGYDVAWYELGTVYEAPGMMAKAANAYSRAFALVPMHPVYAMAYGRALWIGEYQAARIVKAKQLKQPEELVELSPVEAKLKLDRAQQLLEYAVKLVPEQWRAHDSLGDIALANEEYKLAAEDYTRAIARGPKQYDAYQDLARLYREWGYEDEAIAVAEAWMKVRANDDSHEGLYEIAAEAYEAKGDLKKAIALLSIVLAEPARGASNAAFNRARLYVATRQYDKARLDLSLFPTHNRGKMREVNALLAKIPPVKKR